MDWKDLLTAMQPAVLNQQDRQAMYPYLGMVPGPIGVGSQVAQNVEEQGLAKGLLGSAATMATPALVRGMLGNAAGGVVRMAAGQAKKGGEVGKNQEFYKGGQFLPSSERTIKGAIQYPKAQRAGTKAEIEPGKWVPRPADGLKPVKNMFEANWRTGTGQIGDLGEDHQYFKWLSKEYGGTPAEAHAKNKQLIDAYNSGARWMKDGQFFDVDGNPM